MQAKQLSMCLCKALLSRNTQQQQIFWNPFLRRSWLSARRQWASALGLQMHGLRGNS